MYKCLDLAWKFYIGDDVGTRLWVDWGPSGSLVVVACPLLCPSKTAVRYPKPCNPLGSSESFTGGVYTHTVLFYAFSSQCFGSRDGWCDRNPFFSPFISASEPEGCPCKEFLCLIFFFFLISAEQE